MATVALQPSYAIRSGLALKANVLSDLSCAQAIIRAIGSELDPQFRIDCPDGVWWIAMRLKPGEDDRRRQFDLVSDFMAWKLAAGFTLVCETIAPDALSCIGITHREMVGCISHIGRKPLIFSEPRWVTPEAMGRLPDLLPRGGRTLSRSRITQLQKTFGPRGSFPAVNLTTGAWGT